MSQHFLSSKKTDKIEFIEEGFLLSGVESRVGIEVNGVIDSDVVNIAETMLSQSEEKVKENRLILTDKSLKEFLNKKIQFSDIEVVDLKIKDSGKFLSNTLNLLGEVSNNRKYFQLNVVEFDDIKNLFDRMLSYGVSFWNIRSISIGLKQILELKESEIFKRIPNVRVKRIYKIDGKVDLKCAFILKEDDEDLVIYKDFIYNHLNSKLVITESCLVDKERIDKTVIEIVTEGTPVLQKSIFDKDLFFIRGKLKNLSSIRSMLKVSMMGKKSYRLVTRSSNIFLFYKDLEDGDCIVYRNTNMRIIKISSKDDIFYILTSKIDSL